MKTAIIYASTHKGNTRKIVEAIAKDNDIDLFDAVKVKESDLLGYDMIGFASGIYFSKFHKSILDFATNNLPQNKKIFLITTYGGKATYKSIENIIKEKDCSIIGRFGCKGYDTYGAFKLLGGINKEHPDKDDLESAVKFYKELL